ncbi:Uncharacterised protein [Mycobacteroides abscessus subsp. abscessus]|nr:Uncharacterised protein [Mycobacteroides abscessus subsp. abscessus]
MVIDLQDPLPKVSFNDFTAGLFKRLVHVDFFCDH